MIRASYWNAILPAGIAGILPAMSARARKMIRFKIKVE
jgi:hypothetical protein